MLGTIASLDVYVPSDTKPCVLVSGVVCLRIMGLLKNMQRRGRKSLPYSCPRLSRPREWRPEQLDLFGFDDWFYHEGRLLYASQKEDVEET